MKKMKVKLYKAEYCTYCKEVHERLKNLQEKFGFELEVYEYTENPELFENENIDAVPVVKVDEKEVTIEELEHMLFENESKT